MSIDARLNRTGLNRDRLSRVARRLTEARGGGGVVTPSLTISDTSPADGDSITFTVPDEGYDSVEIYDQQGAEPAGSDPLFDTLTLSGSDWTGSVTIDGTAGDQYDLYAQATVGSATAESAAQTVTVTSSYEAETNTYETRVTGAGGTLRDKDWANTRIATLKSNTALADCFFLAGPNMGVTITSGATETLFDASGDERDVTQGTANNRPADNTDAGFGGKYVIDFDGTDDQLRSSAFGTNITWPVTFVMAAEMVSKPDSLFSGNEGTINNEWVGVAWGGGGGGSWVMGSDHDSITNASSPSTSPLIVSGVFDTSSATLRVNGTEVASGALTERVFNILTIGFIEGNNNKYHSGLESAITMLAGDYRNLLSTLESEMADFFGITL